MPSSRIRPGIRSTEDLLPITLLVPVSMKDRLELVCERFGRGYNELIRHFIDVGLPNFEEASTVCSKSRSGAQTTKKNFNNRSG